MTRAALRGARLLCVFRSLELGGTERQALAVADYLRRDRGADVRVWGLCRDAGRFARLCDERGIPWEATPLDWPPGRAGQLRSVAAFALRLRRRRPDVVLPYTWFPDVLCGLAWRASGARLCVWNHRDEGIVLDRSRLHRAAVAMTPCFISNSEHGKRFLRDAYGVSPERIAVIRNGIVLAEAVEDRAAWRRRVGLGAERVAAVMVANMLAYKDHSTLLSAWRKVVDRAGPAGPPVLLLAGRIDETLVGALKALAFDLRLGDAVRFLGAVDDVAGLLRAADLCVHSSRTEGCPNGILEAMAAGLPVAGSDIPGVREAVGPEGHRFLAPPGDAEALADRAAVLLSDGALRASLGASLRERAARMFDAREMCEGTAQFVESKLSEAVAR